jgi:hypothetical protein
MRLLRTTLDIECIPACPTDADIHHFITAILTVARPVFLGQRSAAYLITMVHANSNWCYQQYSVQVEIAAMHIALLKYLSVGRASE